MALDTQEKTIYTCTHRMALDTHMMTMDTHTMAMVIQRMALEDTHMMNMDTNIMDLDTRIMAYIDTPIICDTHREGLGHTWCGLIHPYDGV